MAPTTFFFLITLFFFFQSQRDCPTVQNLKSHKTEKSANHHIWEDGTRELTYMIHWSAKLLISHQIVDSTGHFCSMIDLEYVGKIFSSSKFESTVLDEHVRNSSEMSLWRASHSMWQSSHLPNSKQKRSDGVTERRAAGRTVSCSGSW